YDGLGQMVARRTYTLGGELIEWRRFVYDPAGRLIQELVRDEKPARKLNQLYPQYEFKIDRNYIWGPHGLAFRDLYPANVGPFGERHYAQQDEQGNVAALVSGGKLVDNSYYLADAARVVERYRYEPFGQVNVLAPDYSPRRESDFDWQLLW